MRYLAFGKKTDEAYKKMYKIFKIERDDINFADMKVDVWQDGEPIKPNEATKLSPVFFSHGTM